MSERVACGQYQFGKGAGAGTYGAHLCRCRFPREQALVPVDAPADGFEGLAGIRGTRLQGVHGLAENWLLVVALCDAPEGYDTSAEAAAMPFHAFEWHLTSARVERVLPCSQVIESLEPNGFIVRPADMPLRLVASGASRFAQYCVSAEIVRSVATDWAGDRGDRDDLFEIDRLMRSDSATIGLFDAYLRRALDEDDRPTRLEMDSRASLILLQLLRQHSTLGEGSQRSRRGGLAPHHLRRVCATMTDDLAQEVPLSELAAMVGVSYHHFCHAFKASTGMAPHQWLVERRVERACELLRSTRLSVTEVAAAVGYDDPNQLLRVFRNRRGTTPAGYRREYLAQVGPGVPSVA